MDTKLFYILNYTEIEYQLEINVDGIPERAVSRTLTYNCYKFLQMAHSIFN